MLRKDNPCNNINKTKYDRTRFNKFWLMMQKIKYWFRRKYSQIKRVLDFLPLIWKAYDWDYHYAVELFQHQLKRMANFLESDKAKTLESKVAAARIKTAIELMSKVYDEEYGTEYINDIEKLYGKTKYEFVELEDKDEKGDPYYEMVHSNELAVDKKHQKEIDEVRHQMFLVAKDKQKRAHKLLWDFVEHNIQRWWD